MGRLLYVAAYLPAVSLFAIAVMLNAHRMDSDRSLYVAERARMAAGYLDIQFVQLLELTAFCATAPELIERVDLEQVARNCGRFASRIDAWAVIIELGEVHRQIVNTRVSADKVLPAYLREYERKELIDLELRSRASGSPHIANAFSGILLTEGIVTAGQFVPLADGREVMLYVGMAAASLSEQLSSLGTEGGPVFALIDPSRRIVARSVESGSAMFADAPERIDDLINSSASGTSLGMSRPDVFGGKWDVGHVPLQNASGWLAAAFKPEPSKTIAWVPFSVASGFTLIGFLSTAVLLLGISLQKKGLSREALALEAKDLAMHQNQEKSKLLASLAHDIRSPLISLIGSLEMIEEAKEVSTNKVQLARNSAESLLQLADDILELSFLGSAKMTFHPSPVDLGQLTRSLCNQLQHLADRKGLVVRLELEPDLPPVVEVDRLRLQQVLTNLLTNAIKYTDEGEVILRVCIEDMKSDQIKLDIAVVDTGVGLAAEEMPRIMREFGRLEREADRKETGTGLGLAIVQRLLDAMGSKLCVESVRDHGSRFHFTLTLPVLPAQAVLSDALTLANCVILYAEDEPVIRQLTSQRLKDAGAHVVTAADGEDALRLLCDVTPDLLLIDLQMPGLDGVGLIRRLRETSPEVGYPIFVLTSHISGPLAADARAAGADAVFTKPIQVSALRAAMRARHGNNGRSTPSPEGKWDIAEELLLDIDVIENISAFKDRSKAATLIADFEAAIRTDFAAIIDAINTQDTRQTAKIAHRAQGLCLVIGANHVAVLLKRIEVTAEGPTDTAMRASLVSDLDTALDSTVKALRKKFDCEQACNSDPVQG